MKNIVVIALLLLAAGVGLGEAGSSGVPVPSEGLEPAALSKVDVVNIQVAQAGQGAGGGTFKEVEAIIQKYHCTVCHVGAEPRGGLRLDSYDSIMKGSKDGPVVVPGVPEKSELLLRVMGAKDPRMPMTGPPWLSDDEVKILENWIKDGAKGPKS